MERKSTELKRPLRLLLSASLILLSLSAACSAADQLWFERGKGGTAAKSQEITKAQGAFVSLAKEMNPTVVNIFTTHKIKTMGSQRMYPDDIFRFFDEFMGGRGGQRREFYRSIPREQKTMALGSGFLINKQGHILTNNHVIDGADKINVKLFDGKEYEAKVIGRDPEIDVALIKINVKKDLPFAYLGDSSKVEVGEWAVAIGNPVGQSNTVTAGIVSAKGRLIPDVNVYSDFIQTDAAINPGNSGGPLINVNGEVIGINTAINRSMGGVPIEGIGFAIPINNVKKVLEQLLKGEKITHKRTWLGVSLGNITTSIAESMGIKDDVDGAIVTEVFKDTPAQKAGIKVYDVIVSFDGKPVKSPTELTMMIRSAQPNKAYEFELIRNKSKQKLVITLGEKVDEGIVAGNREDTEDNGQGLENGKTNSGIYVEPVTKESIKKYRLEDAAPGEGVVIVDIDYESPAAMAGLASGDIILEVNRSKVSDRKTFDRLFKTKGSNMLKVKRGDRIMIIGISVQ